MHMSSFSMAAGLLFLFLLGMVAETVGQEEEIDALQKVPHAVQWIGRGYNLLFADPDLVGFGQSQRTPRDPGRTLTNVLQITRNEGRTDGTGTFSLPDQVEYAISSQDCASSTHSSLYFGAKSYQNKLSQSVTVSGGVPTVAKFAFTAGFSRENSVNSTSQKAYLDSRQTCFMGEARYRSNADPRLKLVGEDFARAVCELPTEDDVAQNKTSYLVFFRHVGTHVITHIAIGSGELKRITMTTNKLATIAANSNNFGVDVSGGTPKFTLGVSTSLEQSQVNEIEENTQDESTSTFRIGSETDPGLINLQVDDLVNYVSSTFWRQSCEDAEFPGHDCCDRVDQIGTNIRNALELYPKWLKLEIPQDPELHFPVVWPIGFYGLPMPKTDCPEGQDFEWMRGYRLQTTQSHTHFNGDFPEDTFQNGKAKQYFCIKDNEKGSPFAKPWPPGSYCIFKSGTECPAGLSEGWVWWNDVGRHQGRAGFLPTGEYGHDTTIYFCCREDSPAVAAIVLPTERPFFLLKKGESCQRVVGMEARDQFLHIDTQVMDLINKVVSRHNRPKVNFMIGARAYVQLSYCHYRAEE